jgi:hypothetical protein
LSSTLCSSALPNSRDTISSQTIANPSNIEVASYARISFSNSFGVGDFTKTNSAQTT